MSNGTLDASGQATLSGGGLGIYGGTLQAGSLAFAGGSFGISGGDVTVTNQVSETAGTAGFYGGSFNAGSLAVSGGSLGMSGGTLDASGALTISGTGSIGLYNTAATLEAGSLSQTGGSLGMSGGNNWHRYRSRAGSSWALRFPRAEGVHVHRTRGKSRSAHTDPDAHSPGGHPCQRGVARRACPRVHSRAHARGSSQGVRRAGRHLRCAGRSADLKPAHQGGGTRQRRAYLAGRSSPRRPRERGQHPQVPANRRRG